MSMNSEKGTCPVRKEGLPLILSSAWIALVCAALGWAAAAVLFLLAMLFCLQFFRDPERIVPQDPDAAVSPADGRIIAADLATDPFDGQKKPHLAIFMHGFNVHVNRSPAACTVTGQRYSPGRFLGAARSKVSEENEQNALRLEEESGESFCLVQIAGWMARRILVWAEKDQHLQRGQRLGMIQFGSRVDLYLPQSYEITVSVREKVLAGQTIVARAKQSSGENSTK